MMAPNICQHELVAEALQNQLHHRHSLIDLPVKYGVCDQKRSKGPVEIVGKAQKGLELAQGGVDVPRDPNLTSRLDPS